MFHAVAKYLSYRIGTTENAVVSRRARTQRVEHLVDYIRIACRRRFSQQHATARYDLCWRGHGRSEEPGRGYDFDTLADDLAEVIELLDLRDLILVGHSMGCVEVVRYLSRPPAGRVAGAVLVATITPFTLKTADNPAGIEESVLENGRMALARDRPGQIAKAAAGFFGVSPNVVSSELIDGWIRMMLDGCSLKVMLDLHRTFTRTDFRAVICTSARMRHTVCQSRTWIG
jgi:pimeloyl-ACP methyl ester carboxylesterase